MDIKDLDRYNANIIWFNRFFKDIKQLVDRIVDSLPLENIQPKTPFYYPKFNYVPSIPPYILTALAGSNGVIQIYAVLDPEIIGDKDYFVPEPSLIIVTHSTKDRVLYTNGYGLNVIQNKSERFAEIEDGVISGQIPGNEKVQFQAFQVLLSQFTVDRNVDEIIQEKIVNVISRLPELS